MDYQKIAVFLIGNATHDAEVKQARESGNRYGDFRLAVRDHSGETNFFPIRCFGKMGEATTAIKKGTKVFVAGELEISAFTSEEGGKRMTFRVVADTYRILNGRRRAAEEQEAAAEIKSSAVRPGESQPGQTE